MRLFANLLILAGALGLVVLGFVPFAPPRNVNDANMAKAALDIINRELAAFQTQNGRLPSTQEGLRLLDPGGSQRFLQGDPWGTPWIYRNPTNQPGLDFDLYSAGANTVDDGGEADDLRADTELFHESYQAGPSLEYRFLIVSSALLVTGFLARFVFR